MSPMRLTHLSGPATRQVKSRKSDKTSKEMDCLDLSQSLPFTHCKIVLRLEDEDDDDSGKPRNGWVKEEEEFVFYDSITSSERDRLAIWSNCVSSNPNSSKRIHCATVIPRPFINPDSMEIVPVVNKRVTLAEHLRKIAGKFSNDDNVTKDSKQVSVPRIYKCPYCFQPFHEAQALVGHLPLHTGKTMEDAPDDRINETPVTRTQEKILKGAFCKVVLARCDNLLKQFGLGLGRKKLSLNVTNDRLDTKKEKITTSSINEAKNDTGLSAHNEPIQPTHDRRRTLQRRYKWYKCPQCSKLLTKKYNFECHLLIHKGIKPHKCNVCQKTFSRRSHLNVHLLVHNGIRPFKCSICPKAFSQRTHLNRHLLTHSGIKPHGCNLCPKTFSRRDYLEDHLLKHSGIKPHKCNLCPKAFSQRCRLNRHILVHGVE